MKTRQPGVSQQLLETQDFGQPKSENINNIWCLGGKSNPHGSYEPQDFKSYRPIFLAQRFSSKTLVPSPFRALFDPSRFRSKMSIFGGRVSRVSAKFNVVKTHSGECVAKRFADTNLTRKAWFRQLPPVLKCAWRFLTDECDNSGAWSIDQDAMEFYVGERVDLDQLLYAVNTDDEIRLVRLGKDKLFLVGFIRFQYGQLSEACKPHKPIIQRLTDLGLWSSYLKGFPKGFETLQDKKGKEKEWNGKGKETESASENVDNWSQATTLDACIHSAILAGDSDEFDALTASLPPARKTAYTAEWTLRNGKGTA